MSCLELMKREEVRLFENYIDTYATTEYGVRTVSGEYILRVWDEAKSQYLLKLFGGKDLILSKDIQFKKDNHQIQKEICDLTNKHPFVYRDFDRFLNHVCPRNTVKSYELFQTLQSLIYSDSLYKNRYEGTSFSIDTPDGKELKINNGARVMPTLRKIAEKFSLDMSNYEDFRLEISRILNTKQITGKLNLSIHPMDYATMSDNDCDWESCMSWQQNGCYRQGTVEMMNSPCVIVAYLSSAHDMHLWGEDYWNNKKWRELFIVDKNIITNIKAYPFHNTNLTTTVLTWLKELYDKNLAEDFKVDFTKTYMRYDSYEEIELENGNKFTFEPETGYMYNDFENSPYENLAYFNVNNKYDINLCYSGLNECLGCGDTDVDFYNGEGLLFGPCCDQYVVCELCDEHFPDDSDFAYIDGIYLCPYCYDSRVENDAITDEPHLKSGMDTIYLVDSDLSTIAQPIYVLDCFALMQNTEYFTNIHIACRLNTFGENIFYVTTDDCTQKGFELFDLHDDGKAYPIYPIYENPHINVCYQTVAADKYNEYLGNIYTRPAAISNEDRVKYSFYFDSRSSDSYDMELTVVCGTKESELPPSKLRWVMEEKRKKEETCF